MPSLIGNKPNQVPSNGDLGTLAFQDGVVPAGSLVGTTATQTLTNKTIDATQLVNASVTPEKLSTQSQYTGFKNRIINGAMQIDQRNAGASVNNSSGASYTLDRWQTQAGASGKFSVQQVTTAPTGFANSIKITSLAATSVGSTDYYEIAQSVEGLNIADLGWGASGASSVTLSFWVQSSLTGTFGGAITNSGSTRSYPFSYTISSANTWEQKSVTIAGDTTGTWLKTNGVGLTVRFSLGMGSTYSNTAGSWYSGDYESATGATSVVGTNGATFYITGVQLEKGSTATSFDYRPYGTELALCQRYYYRLNANSTGISCAYTTAAYNTGASYGAFNMPVTMRSAPTTNQSRAAALSMLGNATSSASTAIASGNNSPTTVEFVVNATFVQGYAYTARFAATTDWLDFSAEL